MCASGEADELDDGMEDRPRFCSLDPPSEVHERRQSYNRRGDSYEDFSEACRRGQVSKMRSIGDGRLAKCFV